MSQTPPAISEATPADATPDHPTQGTQPGMWARLARRRTTNNPHAEQPAPATPTKVVRVAIEPPAPEPKPTARTTPPRPSRSRWDMAAVVALAAGVLIIVVVGIRVGMGALKDAALAAHIAPAAADEYWIGVDGLIVVAIVAALVLRNVPGARRYCLGVVAFFTAASGLLQYLHGLGWFTPDKVSGVIKPLPWGVVLVIALLVIGTIFCGTHLFVHVLRCLFPASAPDPRPTSEDAESTDEPERQQDTGERSDATTPNHPPTGDALTPDAEREVRKWFAAIAIGILLDNDVKPVRKKIAAEFGISDRQVGYVIADVEREREAEAERKVQEQEAARAAKVIRKPVDVSTGSALAGVGSVNGAVPSSAGGA